MHQGWKVVSIVIPILALGAGRASAQGRELLFQRDASDRLKAVAAVLCDPGTEKVSYAKLTREAEFFVRIAPRKSILTTDNHPQENAILGTKPIVFLTTPQSATGRSLLDMYQDIGYEAEDILRWQRDQDMVAIVFRYKDDVTPSEVKDGKLPADHLSHTYMPTWENMFTLLDRLAEGATIEPDKQGEFAPQRLFFRSSAERNFVLSFPAEGRQRVKRASYGELKAIGGSDWVYRKMLEAKLSVFEHFLGTGRTHNEVLDPDGLDPEAGLIEFVGPNRALRDLAEVAIVHLGQLSFEDTYSLKRPGSARPKP